MLLVELRLIPRQPSKLPRRLLGKAGNKPSGASAVLHLDEEGVLALLQVDRHEIPVRCAVKKVRMAKEFPV